MRRPQRPQATGHVQESGQGLALCIVHRPLPTDEREEWGAGTLLF